jgi:hypothetical protein
MDFSGEAGRSQWIKNTFQSATEQILTPKLPTVMAFFVHNPIGTPIGPASSFVGVPIHPDAHANDSSLKQATPGLVFFSF